MRIRLVALTICLALFFSPPLISVVNAADMSPLQGKVGTQITVSGLDSGLEYVIKWDGTEIKTGVVPSSDEVQFPAPESSGGSHTVSVEVPPGAMPYQRDFTILPSISIDAVIGNVGDSIEVSGTGFGEDESDIEVTYDGTSEKTGITADENGSWEATLPIPASTKGNHAIDASGSETDAADVSDLSFKVAPRLPSSRAWVVSVRRLS